MGNKYLYLYCIVFAWAKSICICIVVYLCAQKVFALVLYGICVRKKWARLRGQILPPPPRMGAAYRVKLARVYCHISLACNGKCKQNCKICETTKNFLQTFPILHCLHCLGRATTNNGWGTFSPKKTIFILQDINYEMTF